MRRSKNRQSNSMIVTHSQPKHLTICVKLPPIMSSIMTKHGVIYLKNNFKQIVARQHKLSNAIGNRILITGITYAQIKLNTSRSMYSILVIMPSKKYAKSISNASVVCGFWFICLLLGTVDIFSQFAKSNAMEKLIIIESIVGPSISELLVVRGATDNLLSVYR